MAGAAGRRLVRPSLPAAAYNDAVARAHGKREPVAEYLTGEAMRAYLPALERTAELIDGFESPLGLELLATVDWLLEREHCAPEVAALRLGLQRWPGGQSAARRKLRILDGRLVGIALAHLRRPVPEGRTGEISGMEVQPS